jgi:hypothetical protein
MLVRISHWNDYPPSSASCCPIAEEKTDMLVAVVVLEEWVVVLEEWVEAVPHWPCGSQTRSWSACRLE